jgi:16S rRNA processing protein RimM
VKATAREERITIGKVLKPRGLRGDVKILPLTDIPDRFEQLHSVTISLAHGRELTLEIERVTYYKSYVYLRFSFKDSLEAVQELVGGLLQVDLADVPELPEGMFYQFEILESAVYTDQQQYLGRVVDILETGSHDVYVIQGDSREYLIPATQHIVRHIDRERRTITIHPLEGLLEI